MLSYLPICSNIVLWHIFIESSFFILSYSKLEIPMRNCIGFASNNCNVMIGSKNSVLTRVRERQPHVLNIGCICHLADLCVKAGVKQLSMAVDDLFIDVYFHFQNRSVYTVFIILLFRCKVYVSIGWLSDWGHLDWILSAHIRPFTLLSGPTEMQQLHHFASSFRFWEDFFGSVSAATNKNAVAKSRPA